MDNVFKNAKKIWHPNTKQINAYVDFFDTFHLYEKCQAKLYISADSDYCININNTPVYGNQFADFPTYKVYDEYDITDYLKAGTNNLFITAYYQGESSFTYKVGSAGLIFEIKTDDGIICYSSEKTKCRENEHYVGGEIERLTFQASFSFRYNSVVLNNYSIVDALLVEDNSIYFKRPVKKMIVSEPCKTKLQTQGIFYAPKEKDLPCGELMQKSALVYLSDKEMGFDENHQELPNEDGLKLCNSNGDGLYLLFDLMKERAGYLLLDITLDEEADIYIGFGEQINSLRVRTSIDGRQFSAVYHGKKGRNTFIHRFKRIAGRYIQVNAFARMVKVHYVGLIPTEYPIYSNSSFQIKDFLHKKIFEVSKDTLKLCMHEHYEDCPLRERALYTMDSRIEMLSTYAAFKDTDFAKASLKLFSLSQRKNNQIELCAPAEAPIYIPVFTLFYVIESEEYLNYSKDKEFLFEIFNTIENIVKTFSDKIGANGLLSSFFEEEAWNFYEWSKGLDGGCTFLDEVKQKLFSAPLNAYFSITLSSFAKICESLGYIDKSKDALLLKDKINSKMSELFWDEDKKAFSSFIDSKGKHIHYSQLVQALMVSCGATEKEQMLLVEDIIKHESQDFVSMTLGSYYYKYDSLFKISDSNAVFILDDIAERWGNMLFSGATSFWETFNGDDELRFHKAASLCHGWASLPIYEYSRFSSLICKN